MPSKIVSFPADPHPLLLQVRRRMTQRELATRLQKSSKTIARWESGEIPCPAILEPALREILQEGRRPKSTPSSLG